MEHRRNVVDIAQRVGGHTSNAGMLGDIPSIWLEQYEEDYLEASAFMVAMLIRAGAPVTDGVLDKLVGFIQNTSGEISGGEHLAVEEFHLFSLPGCCGLAAPSVDPDMPAEDIANATAAIAELMSRAFESAAWEDAGQAPRAVLRFLSILADQQHRMTAMQAIVDQDLSEMLEEYDVEDDEAEVEMA